ncbi:helix-turn-helix domain-containing protein (plasmid) [Streptomyces platensis]|uniref:hypothetical protein n=1 Tax=Streptomyces platensis TaxID=58346 RepID=UPI002ED49203|nr:helix-turn-helix domain-containing protein [Streptomyces platensis]
MSYQGQTWVDEVALPRLKNGGELLVMLRVANHAGNGPKKMSGCHASSKTLAKECLMGRSTVLKHLRELTRRALLISGDPALVNHIPVDKRPPVYDLAGAHEPGCSGGHTYTDECQVASVQIEHPKETRRSAGAQSEHPATKADGAGVQNDAERVFKSSTKSSKELKESSLPGGFGGTHRVGGAEEEREAATPKDKPSAVPNQRDNGQDDADRIVAAWGEALVVSGPAPNRRAEDAVRRDAARLLADGEAADYLTAAAVDMAHRNPSFRSLSKHLEHYTPKPAGGKHERCPEHPRHLRGRCLECALTIPA